MNEHIEKQKQEEQRLEAEKIQKKQLFAQRVSAAASVATAVSAAQTAAEVERMRREASSAAEATARHQRVVEIQQAEMAARQEQMAEEQRATNFRQTILTTLPLLKDGEKSQYLIEQLLPMVEKRYESEIGAFVFGDILKVFKFPDFAQNYFATEPDVKKFMIEGKTNPKQKLDEATTEYKKASKELDTKHFGAGFLAFIVAVVEFFVLFFCQFKVDNIFYPIILVASLALPPFTFIKVKKSISTSRCKKASELSAKLAVLKSEMDRETEVFESWSKNQPEAWKKIKTNLIDSYLASTRGKLISKYDMTEELLKPFWLRCVNPEQTFLPPSARPADEQWLLALKPKIDAEGELLKQRQSQIRHILLSRLAPNYDTECCDVIDPEKKFVELDFERPDAIPERPMSDKEVAEMVSSLTELIQSIQSSEQCDDVLALVKNKAADELAYLRSTITTNSPALHSRLEKIGEKYEEQRAYLQSKTDEEIRLLKARHPEKFS